MKINQSIKQWALGAPGLSGTSEAVGGEPEAYSHVCAPSQEKAAFRELIAQLELDPKCRGLPLSSFLILPFQRITRLKLLVQVPPLPPGRRAGGACVYFRCTPVSFGQSGLRRLSRESVPPILIKRLLCAKQRGAHLFQGAWEGEISTHTARKWSWL